MKYFSYVCIMKSEQEQENYPGIYKGTFKLVLTHEFFPKEILNEALVVIKTKEHPTEGMFISKVVSEELFLHHQFLYKYSQFMWGL